MVAYYIWNPHLVSDNPYILEFTLNDCDVSGIAQDSSFFTMLMKDIGLDLEVTKWEIKPCRSKYYSDYLGEEDWRDNWQFIWKVRIKTKHLVGTLPVFKSQWMPSDATGENLLQGFSIKETNCLVESSFRNEKALKTATENILNSTIISQMQEKYAVGQPNFHDFTVLKKYKQLQIDLGKFPDSFYEEGADYAEQVLSTCKEAGGKINHNEIS